MGTAHTAPADVFKAIISRDQGTPWGSSGQSSSTWLDVPTELVLIRDLVATQPGVLLHALTEDVPRPVGGDLYPHVIHHQGTYYLEDGHHRAVRALLGGDPHMVARVLHMGCC